MSIERVAEVTRRLAESNSDVDPSVAAPTIDDSELEQTLHALLELAISIADVENAVINIIDEQTQTPLVTIGKELTPVPASASMCLHTVKRRELVYAPDAQVEPLFDDSPFVHGDDGIVRLYASAPMISWPGRVLGTLCVYSEEPGTLQPQQLMLLRTLADQAGTAFTLRETTRRLRAERDRAEAKQRELRRLLDVTTAAFWQLDVDGVIRDWNPAATAMLGFREADVIGHSLFEAMVPTDFAEVAAAGLARMALEDDFRPTSMDATMLDTQGRRHDLELTLWYTRGPELRINAFARDVTEERAASDRLREAEERWRLAFETAPIGMSLIEIREDSSLRFLQVNTALARILGYSTSELVTMDPRLIMAESERDAARTTQRDLLAEQGQVYHGERHMIHADGHEVWVRVSAAVTATAGGSRWLVAQFEDITVREQQSRQLQETVALLELTQVAMIVRDINGVVSLWNAAAERMYGITAARAMGRRTHDLLETRFPEPLEQIEAQLRDCGSWEGQLIHIAANGSERIVVSRWALQTDPDGRETVLEVNSDITESARAQERQRAAEQLFQTAFVHSTHGVGLLGTRGDDRGRWLQANEAMAELWSVDSLIGRSLLDMFDPADIAELVPPVQALFAGTSEAYSAEWRIPARGGYRYVAAHCVAAPGDHQQERVIVVQLEDVTRRRAHDDWLQRQATVDPLTALPNRLAIGDQLERMLQDLAASTGQLTVMFVDLDRFKAVNDVHGHAAGDAVLTDIARQLEVTAGDDAMVGRLGGDEFVVLRGACDDACARELADDLSRQVGTTIGDGDDQLTVGVSVGWATTGDPSTAAQELLSRADLMMYERKRARRLDSAGRA
jgi:diguanylate cyclase (GGDEF)-like protein/PAS domain S-box-containing protein